MNILKFTNTRANDCEPSKQNITQKIKRILIASLLKMQFTRFYAELSSVKWKTKEGVHLQQRLNNLSKNRNESVKMKHKTVHRFLKSGQKRATAHIPDTKIYTTSCNEIPGTGQDSPALCCENIYCFHSVTEKRQTQV